MINGKYFKCSICDKIVRCGNTTNVLKYWKKNDEKVKKLLTDTPTSLRQSFIVWTFQKGGNYQVTGYIGTVRWNLKKTGETLRKYNLI